MLQMVRARQRSWTKRVYLYSAVAGCVALLSPLVGGCDSEATAIPHAVAAEQNADCVACHKPHHTDDRCVNCHHVQESWLPIDGTHPSKAGTSAPWVTHQTPKLDDASCRSCHDSGKWDAPEASHETQASCVECHGSNS